MDTNERENTAQLGTIYRYYVIYESLLINLVGFVTLFFQCELQALAPWIQEKFPSLSQAAVEAITGHFWLKEDLNCNSDATRCLTKMVAGWLMIAGVLQVFINFDGLRRLVFKSDWVAPRGIKITCMYAYFVCDWYWVVLMWAYRGTIGWQQIVGSAVDIAIRIPFAHNPDLMFSHPQPKQLNRQKHGAQYQSPLLDERACEC